MGGELGGSVGVWGPSARARVALAAFAAATACCLAVALSPDPNPPFVPPPGATSDLDLYKIVVGRVRGGEPYYDVLHEELVRHGYPTRSPFNWRTPVYAYLLGRGVGLRPGRWLLLAGVLGALALTCRDLLDDCGVLSAALGGAFLVGSMAWCSGGDTYLFMELWSGMLVLLSACALRRGWTAAGVGLGLFAVFYRELALPYAVACLAVAARNGRKREAAAWVAGLALFVGFLACHAQQVHARLTPADQALAGGWLRFGGVRFLLTTAQANVFLMPLPLWCTALYLPLAGLGLSGLRGESGGRVGLTGFLYLAAFAVVGNPFNFYWGFIDAPLLAYGLAHAPAVLRSRALAAFPNAFAPRPARACAGAERAA